jgi:hypothetical protein
MSRPHPFCSPVTRRTYVVTAPPTALTPAMPSAPTKPPRRPDVVAFPASRRLPVCTEDVGTRTRPTLAPSSPSTTSPPGCAASGDGPWRTMSWTACEAADQAGVEVRGVQKSDAERGCTDERIECVDGNKAVEEAVAESAVGDPSSSSSLSRACTRPAPPPPRSSTSSAPTPSPLTAASSSTRPGACTPTCAPSPRSRTTRASSGRGSSSPARGSTPRSVRRSRPASLARRAPGQHQRVARGGPCGRRARRAAARVERDVGGRRG